MPKSGEPAPLSLPAVRTNLYIRSITAGLIIGGTVLLVVYGGPSTAHLHTAVELLLGFLRSAGPWIFFLAMAILPALGLPLLPFALAAGPAFGPQLGPLNVALCASAAIAANVALTYLLARRLVGPLIGRLLKRMGYRLPALPTGTAWQAVLMIRLAPGLPFWVQSYLLGLLGVAWIPYFVVSTVVPAFFIGGVIIFGEAIWQGEARTALMGATIVGLALSAVGLWRRIHQNRSNQNAGAKSPLQT